MSFFPHSVIAQHPRTSSPFTQNHNTNHDNPSSFHPLFRLLDDFDQYSRASEKPSSGKVSRQHHHNPIMKTFTPKFDVNETAETYELHGELPGIEQSDIDIEFVDAETLTIKGKVERSYTSGTAPSSIGATSEKAAIKEKAHQPSVEDEEGTSNEVAAKEEQSTKTRDVKQEPKDKLWVSERSVGEFSRSFTFPVRVDQDAVKASMRNGVLSVVVPKAKKVAYKKITVE